MIRRIDHQDGRTTLEFMNGSVGVCLPLPHHDADTLLAAIAEQHEAELAALRAEIERKDAALRLFALSDETWRIQVLGRGLRDQDTLYSWKVGSYRAVRAALQPLV